MKKLLRIASICLIGYFYTVAGLADGQKAIWGTDGQALTEKKPSVKTVNPDLKKETIKTPEQQIKETPKIIPSTKSTRCGGGWSGGPHS